MACAPPCSRLHRLHEAVLQPVDPEESGGCRQESAGPLPPPPPGHLQQQPAVPREGCVALLATGGPTQGQIVVPRPCRAGLRLPASQASLRCCSAPGACALATSSGAAPRRVVSGAQQGRQLLHPLLQLHHLTHQQLHVRPDSPEASAERAGSDGAPLPGAHSGPSGSGVAWPRGQLPAQGMNWYGLTSAPCSHPPRQPHQGRMA